ncbi:uncharacterized protein LOC124173099 [Ischnura elegans]|uniref:uncharacterized protein LOC124173099 n=1 Tax=Ischnura elegans TaxID=197161 RepID=UPI001ED86874|nr:uncharacterized protein LOC124173099 [Ischnura elegans]
MSARVILKFEEMVRYLGGNVGSRCVIEGECVFNAGLVMVVGTRGSREEGKINILSFVLQTSALSKDPVQVSGTLEVTEEGDLSARGMSCSCKAGNSEKCKHVSATLWYLYRNDIESLEELSSTDVKCLWTQRQKKDASTNYGATKIKEFCHIMRSGEKKCTPQGFGELCMKTLLAACPDSALALHRVGRIHDNFLDPEVNDVDMME